MPRLPPKYRRKSTATADYERHRKSAAKRGYDREWRKARKQFLAHNPLCLECQAEKVITASTQVDHIVPHNGDPILFWDTDNWQALCHTHHSRKTRRESAQVGNQ